MEFNFQNNINILLKYEANTTNFIENKLIQQTNNKE